MSQQQLTELFRVSNKLSYEIDGQISEIHCGKYLSQEHASQDIKSTLVPLIHTKIARLNEYMEELQGLFDTLQDQNGKVVASLKKNDDSLTYWKE